MAPAGLTTTRKPDPLPPSAADGRLVVHGMCGLGDNIHQRAVLRELMKSREVTLYAPYAAMYHDMAAQGLDLRLRPFRYTSALEPGVVGADAAPGWQRTAGRDEVQMGYQPDKIRQHGSILAAQFAAAGLAMPERPDFSLPVPESWRAELGRFIPMGRGVWSRPLLVYRPPVENSIWSNRNRPPDLAAYAALYGAIRERFFTVSVARLIPGKEWLIGDEQPADLRLEAGQLSFKAIAALFAEAAVVFCCAGFAPVLAQAVGTPTIVIYGGNEGFRTTQRTGAHLAPTLPIEPVVPCDCHDRTHNCDKTIALEPAMERIEAFLAEHACASLSSPRPGFPTPAERVCSTIG